MQEGVQGAVSGAFVAEILDQAAGGLGDAGLHLGRQGGLPSRGSRTAVSSARRASSMARRRGGGSGKSPIKRMRHLKEGFGGIDRTGYGKRWFSVHLNHRTHRLGSPLDKNGTIPKTGTGGVLYSPHVRSLRAHPGTDGAGPQDRRHRPPGRPQSQPVGSGGGHRGPGAGARRRRHRQDPGADHPAHPHSGPRPGPAVGGPGHDLHQPRRPGRCRTG